MVASNSRMNELFSGSFNPYTFSSVPRSVGTDFSIGGKRDVDIFETLLDSSTKQSSGASKSAGPAYDTSKPVPSESLLETLTKFRQSTLPIDLYQQEQQARIASQLTREQLASLYPYLSAAGAESTARNLAASQQFRAFKEQMPSSVQDIMASKQSQMASAASAEAQRQIATATQQDAAKRFAGSFAGKYIQAA